MSTPAQEEGETRSKLVQKPSFQEKCSFLRLRHEDKVAFAWECLKATTQIFWQLFLFKIYNFMLELKR